MVVLLRDDYECTALEPMVMLPYGDEEYYVLDPSDDVDAQWLYMLCN